MGTRAQFFIGNPEDIEIREWLGTVAWDGYPDGDIGQALDGASSEDDFRQAINSLKEKRDDFCDPDANDFPFPWCGDLFLTDCTYAMFDGRVQLTRFHTGWVDLAEYRSGSDEYKDAYSGQEDQLPRDVHAPKSTGKDKGPDSIITVSVVS